MSPEQAIEIIKILNNIEASIDAFAIIGIAVLGFIAGIILFRGRN